MDDILDLIMAIVPLIIIFFIISTLSKMWANSRKQSRIIDRKEVETIKRLLTPKNTIKNQTICKNCKINKAIDDGFDLCQPCKENPGWWFVG